MLGIEPGVGSKVDRDLGDVADRKTVPRRRFDVHGQRLDLVSGDEESPDHVEPEVLVPGVTERQDPFAHDHDSQGEVTDSLHNAPVYLKSMPVRELLPPRSRALGRTPPHFPTTTGSVRIETVIP